MEPILLLYLMPENFTHQLWSTMQHAAHLDW